MTRWLNQLRDPVAVNADLDVSGTTDLSAVSDHATVPDTLPPAGREVVAVSPALDRTTGIVVCIPSFRRAGHLRLTLASLAAQTIRRKFAVVIVENDAIRREAAAVAAEMLGGGGLRGLCVVEPRQGNCQAINAAFETARHLFADATHFLMIDDDEIASPDWLARMVDTAERSGADVVGGPVQPNFDDDGKRWLARHPAFRAAYDTSGPVPVIYGCGNCLITAPVFARLADPDFDLRFNFLGGGDTDFFWRCRNAGMKFHWAEDAVITETVPATRTHPAWLAVRGLRIGAINYHVQLRAAPTFAARAGVLTKMLTKLLGSPFVAARLLFTEKAMIALHPMTVATGSVLAAVGMELQPYKASKIAS